MQLTKSLNLRHKLSFTWKIVLVIGLFIFTVYLMQGALWFWIIGVLIKLWAEDEKIDWVTIGIGVLVITLLLWVLGFREFNLF